MAQARLSKLGERHKISHSIEKVNNFANDDLISTDSKVRHIDVKKPDVSTLKHDEYEYTGSRRYKNGKKSKVDASNKSVFDDNESKESQMFERLKEKLSKTYSDKSSLDKASSSTLIGNLPCNSGSKSEGFAN